MSSSLLYPLTVGAYLGLGYFYRPGAPEGRASTFAGRLLLFLPLLLHVYLLGEVVFPAGGLSLGFGATVSAVAALTVLFYGLAAWHYPLAGMQALVLIFAAVAVTLQGLLPSGPVVASSDLPLFRLHLVLAFVAYGLFTIAALQAAMMAVAERHLHKPVPPRMVAGMPPLLTLETLLFHMVELGFLILTVTLVSGIFFSEAIYGHPLPRTHMTVFGIGSWLIYAALLAGRRLYGWRGRTAVRWTLAGFVALLLSYVGVRFVVEVILHRT